MLKFKEKSVLKHFCLKWFVESVKKMKNALKWFSTGVGYGSSI